MPRAKRKVGDDSVIYSVFETRMARIEESGAGYSATKITSTADSIEWCKSVFVPYFADKMNQEEFLVATLDTKHRPTAIIRITRGTLDASLVHPREVFRAAIEWGASAILLIHNHPSGDPTPSREDIAVTDRLKEVGKVVGITVLDHIVVGDTDCVSVLEQR